jgi:hypothetical protein
MRLASRSRESSPFGKNRGLPLRHPLSFRSGSSIRFQRPTRGSGALGFTPLAASLQGFVPRDLLRTPSCDAVPIGPPSLLSRSPFGSLAIGLPAGWGISPSGLPADDRPGSPGLVPPWGSLHPVPRACRRNAVTPFGVARFHDPPHSGVAARASTRASHSLRCRRGRSALPCPAVRPSSHALRKELPFRVLIPVLQSVKERGM